MCGRPCYVTCPDCTVGVAAPSPNVGDPVESNGAAIQSKLDAHDLYARSAVRYLIDWLRDDPEPLLAMARGRHAEGHYRHRDALMFEYSQDELTAEAAQELADAVCYIALKIQRAT